MCLGPSNTVDFQVEILATAGVTVSITAGPTNGGGPNRLFCYVS